MTLRSRVFERNVRRQVRRSVEGDAALRAERRRMEKRDRLNSIVAVGLFQILTCIALGCAVPACALARGGSDWLLVLLTLFTAGQMLSTAYAFGAGLPCSELALQLRHYPLWDEGICRACFSARMRRYALNLILYTFIYGAFFVGLDGGPRGASLVGLSLGAAALLWLSVTALSLGVAALTRHPVIGLLAGATSIGAVAAALFIRPPDALAGGDATALILATPTGWVSCAARGVAAGKYGVAALALGLCAFLLCALPFLFRLWLRRQTPMVDVEFPSATALPDEVDEVWPGSVPDTEPAPIVTAGTGQPVATADGASLTEQRLLPPGAFSAPVNPLASGWIERMVWFLLSARERRLATLAFPDAPKWSSRWSFALVIVLLASLLHFSDSVGWIAYIVVAVTTMCVVPLLGGSWDMLTPALSAGGYSPLYALYPVQFRDAGAIIFKANAVRILAWTPVALAYVAWSATYSGGNTSADVLAAAKLALVVLTAQPALLACLLFMRTGHPENLTVYGVILSVGGFLAVLFGIGLASMVFLFEGPLWALACVGFAAWSYGMWDVFARVHNGGRTDLVRIYSER